MKKRYSTLTAHILKKVVSPFLNFCLVPCYWQCASTTLPTKRKKKENNFFKVGERGQILSLEVGIKVMTPKGKGTIESIIEDIHPSANVRMEDGTLKNFMHPTTEFVNGNLEFVWQLKHI